jgi:hypothetical protein
LNPADDQRDASIHIPLTLAINAHTRQHHLLQSRPLQHRHHDRKPDIALAIAISLATTAISFKLSTGRFRN